MRTLRIFISSPGDVAEERDKAKQVIADLQRRYDDQVALLPVLWEDLAIPATASFQEGIDFVLAERHRIDIAVFILWSRLGSPLGTAIRKQDGSPYLSGTEREFDVMLAAFEQSGGKVPIILAYTRRDDKSFSEQLDATKLGEDALTDLLTQRKLVNQFISERFNDKDGTNLRAYHSYREPIGFAQRLHIHLRGAIDELLDLESISAMWTGPPYRSLEVFDIQHAPIFCGRDEETCDLLQRLRDQEGDGCAYVCIVGASGSGKSSLARAGVAATLSQRSFDDGVKEWRAAVFMPSLKFGDSYLTLASSLAEPLPELRSGIGGIEGFADCLRDQNFKAASILLETAINQASRYPSNLHTTSNQDPGTKNSKRSLRLLLIFDQMEELWTEYSITPEQRERFLQAIEGLARSTHLSVLATLRSDFYPQAQLSEAFLRMKGERGHFDLTPPGIAALQELIVQPAHRAGLTFERDGRTSRTLDQRILDDAARDPSALPLIEYALRELYERRQERSPYAPPWTQPTLSFAVYDSMGGVEGALGHQAAQIFNSLPADARTALDELLPLLVAVDPSGDQHPVRRRAALADLRSTRARRMLVESLVKARFLTTDEQIGVPIASLAHEALLHRWDRITEWIAVNARYLRLRANVEHDHARWQAANRDPSLLLAEGFPLEDGKRLLTQAPTLLSSRIKDYIDQSRLHHESNARRLARIRRIVVSALSILTLAAVAASVWAMKRQSDAVTAKNEALANGNKAQESLSALRQERSAAFESTVRWLRDDGFFMTPVDTVQLSAGQGTTRIEIPVTTGMDYVVLVKLGEQSDFEVEIRGFDGMENELDRAGSSLCRWFHFRASYVGSIYVFPVATQGSGDVTIFSGRRGTRRETDLRDGKSGK